MSRKTYVTAANVIDSPMDIEQQTITSSRIKIADITFSPWFKRLGLDFPLFTDEVMAHYQQHNVQQFNPFVFIPALLVLYIMVAVCFGLPGYHMYNGGDVLGVRIIGTFLILMAMNTSGLYFIYHALRLTKRNILLAKLKKKFAWCPFQVEEMLSCCVQSIATFFLVSRVFVGQCPPDITLFLQQTCNQFASSGGIPSELVYGIYFCPLFHTLILKNIGIRMLIFNNVAGLLSVAFCILYEKLWSDHFALIMWIFFANGSFEIERLQRIGYTQTIKIGDQKNLEMEHLKQEVTLQEALTVQMLTLNRTEDEKRLKVMEAENEKAAKQREMQLNQELQENIANSAHDMKSPACALSLAVGSLITTFYGKSHMDKDGCKMTMDTLKGMMHTLSSLNTIINRSVDAASKLTGNNLTPHMDSIEIRKLVGDIMVFMSWQAENSSLSVKLEPYPEHLPTNILADLKWLREDLLCVAANALKFSQERSNVPIIVRLTIDSNDDDTTPSMLCFSFLDSGRNLSEDQHLKLFNYPQMRSSDRKSMGGMGLGLYCLRERVTAMGGRCGSRLRHDGLEGTEIWFSIPFLDADAQSLAQQEVEVIEKNAAAVEASLSRIPNTSSFVTALGGTHRCTSSFTNDLSSNRDSFDTNDNNTAASSNHHASNALVPNKSKPPRRVRKSSDKSPLLTLKQSFDRISEEKGGVTLPILIVDDSIAILKMIRRSLLNEIPDLVIKEARDGHEAFDRVQEESNGFHVIITDIQMPNCDGFDFTYRVREFEDRNRRSATMVIGMSANYQEKIISQSVRCGMDGFLHKPFQLQTLMDVINHVQLHRDITKQLETMRGIASLSRQSSQNFTKERDWKKASPSSPSVTVTTIPSSLSHAV